jgi:hypothetical protein
MKNTQIGVDTYKSVPGLATSLGPANEEAPSLGKFIFLHKGLTSPEKFYLKRILPPLVLDRPVTRI